MTDYYKDKQQLTDEQIAELAPDWATHYTIIDSDITPSCITFYDGFWHQWFYYKDKNNWSTKLTYNEIPKSAKPIPRKKFDISEYEFSDEAARFSKRNKEFIVLSTGRDFVLDKGDAIALAKHFNLTAEGLK